MCKDRRKFWYEGEIEIKQKIKFYNQREIRKLLDSNERLILTFDGENTFFIRYKDIPDFIVDYNDKFGQTDLKFYEYAFTPIITTFGVFLDYCNPKVRKDIIDRLIYLQTGGKVRKYKVVREHDLEDVRNELTLNNSKKI